MIASHDKACNPLSFRRGKALLPRKLKKLWTTTISVESGRTAERLTCLRVLHFGNGRRLQTSSREPIQYTPVRLVRISFES